MRILLVNTADAGGGAQEIGARLLRGLRARGHEATLAVGHRITNDSAVELLDSDRVRPLPARAGILAGDLLRTRGAERTGRALRRAATPVRLGRRLLGYEDFDYPATWSLVDRNPPPDVVHLHNLHGDYFDLRALPALAARSTVLVTLHDGWMLTGHCAHSFECDRWISGCGPCPHLDVPPALPRDRTYENWRRKRSIYAATCLHVAAPSRWLADRVPRSILASAATAVDVVPNGVDTELFTPGERAAVRRATGLPDDADIVLFAANSTRSNPFKDFATLERVLERLGGRSDRQRPLILISVGEEGATRRVGSAELRMVAHVGAPAALVPWYQAADVYLHPALADTFPTTILEALACGVPVVASSVGGIPEQVESGRTGELVPPQDDAAMAGALEALLDDVDRRQRMGAAARAAAVDRFDAERMVDAYASLYERLRLSGQP
jgi:glycosyltransferase involved in cell wall biosynthesis